MSNIPVPNSDFKNLMRHGYITLYWPFLVCNPYVLDRPQPSYPFPMDLCSLKSSHLRKAVSRDRGINPPVPAGELWLTLGTVCPRRYCVCHWCCCSRGPRLGRCGTLRQLMTGARASSARHGTKTSGLRDPLRRRSWIMASLERTGGFFAGEAATLAVQFENHTSSGFENKRPAPIIGHG